MSDHPVPFGIITKLIYVDDEKDLPDLNRCIADEFFDNCAQGVFLRSQLSMTIAFDEEFLRDMPVLPAPFGAMSTADRIRNSVKQLNTIRHVDIEVFYDQKGQEFYMLMEITRHAGAEWHTQVLMRLSQLLRCIVTH